jgi:hypothetical protein
VSPQRQECARGKEATDLAGRQREIRQIGARGGEPMEECQRGGL